MPGMLSAERPPKCLFDRIIGWNTDKDFVRASRVRRIAYGPHERTRQSRMVGVGIEPHVIDHPHGVGPPCTHVPGNRVIDLTDPNAAVYTVKPLDRGWPDPPITLPEQGNTFLIDTLKHLKVSVSR
jgi:hypothetical protein